MASTLRRCCVCHEVLPPERQPRPGHPGLGTCSPAHTRLSLGLPATFDATQPNGLVLKFNLTLVEGRLKGKANAEAPSGEKREAAVDVGRGK